MFNSLENLYFLTFVGFDKHSMWDYYGDESDNEIDEIGDDKLRDHLDELANALTERNKIFAVTTMQRKVFYEIIGSELVCQKDYIFWHLNDD